MALMRQERSLDNVDRGCGGDPSQLHMGCIQEDWGGEPYGIWRLSRKQTWRQGQ